MSSRRKLYLLVTCIPRLKEIVESGIAEDDVRHGGVCIHLVSGITTWVLAWYGKERCCIEGVVGVDHLRSILACGFLDGIAAVALDSPSSAANDDVAIDPEMGLVVFSARKCEEVIGIIKGKGRQLESEEAVGRYGTIEKTPTDSELAKYETTS
ncbi:hypothetical protein ARMGADRAFT_1032575 [Armillaria gallica]|uniref:Uncharacterized protein n=1 Tax=Armillaria gallica TaxID=47427 RepID=A0A2H3D5R3_ARMGA|nr:hypothetical protein ARMGADRAFT_1032575 [Armillaria gallica]